MALVAFDFDGTLIEGDAGVRFATYATGKRYRRAAKKGVDGAFELARVNLAAVGLVARGASAHLRYELGELDRRGLVERAYEGFKGHDASWIRSEMDAFARERLPAWVRSDIVDQLRDHVDRGDHVVILSTGPHALIWPLRDALGLDVEVVACRLRERDGVLTGRVEGPLNGADKAIRLQALSKRGGFSLEEAWAYGDHEDDAAVLSRVGNAFAVHPTKRMRRIARQRGWPILHDG